MTAKNVRLTDIFPGHPKAPAPRRALGSLQSHGAPARHNVRKGMPRAALRSRAILPPAAVTPRTKLAVITFGLVAVFVGCLIADVVVILERRAMTAKADAEVVSIRRTKPADGRAMYCPTVRWSHADTMHEAEIEHCVKARDGYAIGQRVAVAFDPEHPERVDPDSFWTRYLDTIVLGIFTILFGIAAGFMLKLYIVSARRGPC